MRTIRRFLLPILVVVVLIGAAIVAAIPPAVPVDTAFAERGELLITIDEDGRTRVIDRYVVFAPLAGRMERIALKAGDPIRAGDMLITSIDPSDPALLDARTLAEAEARVRAAEAKLDRTGPERSAALSELEFAQDELARLQSLSEGAAASEQELDDARLRVSLALQSARAAEIAVQIAEFELEQARAALLRTSPPADPKANPNGVTQRLEIPAPITGRVLRVLRDSAGVVAAGAPLIEVGDTTQLEVEVDVLSQDAIKINPGMPVRIERWGGDAVLKGRVRLVEPSGFTKVSALGVEEQRVNVIIDFVDPPEARQGLGDGFRVEARVVLSDAKDVVTAPSGALFRSDDGWGAFIVSDGRAVLKAVRLGRRGAERVEILGGIEPGDELVVYPSDRVEDGARVRAR